MMALKIFGLNLFSDREMSDMRKDTPRPTRGYGLSDQKRFEVYFQPIMVAELYDWAYYSDTYRLILNSLVRETFRNGAEWKEKFTRKCTICGIEYKNDVEICTECKSPTKKPDPTQLLFGRKFFEKVNDNGQSLINIYETQNPDDHIADNEYTVFLKKYKYDKFGRIESATPLEIVRGDPIYMRMVMDESGRQGIDYYSKQRIMVCPEHRDKAQGQNETCDSPNCGKKTYPAFYFCEGAKRIYYLSGEVRHDTLYTQTIFYGFPMALTCLTKIKTLLAEDTYEMQYYAGMKTPKGALLIKTSQTDDAEKAWDNMIDHTQNDPHNIYPLWVPPSGADDKGDFAKYIDFARSLDEMQYTEAKQDKISRVGALFGVQPIFQGDVSTGGGLNNEGLQLTVTTRAIEAQHKLLNTKSKWITEQLGITDWEYVMNPPEEKDEMAEKQREAQDIANAQAMESLNFEVSRTPEGKFKYAKKESAPIPQSLVPFARTPTEQTEAEKTRYDGAPT